MSKIRLIGAVGIKVRPDTSDFRNEVRDALRNVPDEIDVDVNVKVNDKEVKKRLDALDGDRVVNIKVSSDYDSIQAARKQIHSALKNLDAYQIPVNLDEEGLRKAQAKLRRLQSQSKISMEITDDEAGYRQVLAKIQRIKAEKLTQIVDFKTNEKDLDRVAAEYRRKLEAVKPIARLTIQHRNDRDSLTAAIKQVDEALKNLKVVKITPELNKEELLKAREKLEKTLADKPVMLKFSRDKRGWESALEEIKRFQREDAAKRFYFRTDTEGLKAAEEKVREALAKIEANRTISIGYAGNFDGINGAIDEIDKKLADLKKLEIETKLDEASLLKTKAKLEAALKTADVEIKMTPDEKGYKAVLAKVREIQAQKLEKLVTFQTDDASLEQMATDMEAKLKELEDMTVKVGTDPASLTMAIAQIDGALSDLKTIEVTTKLNETDLAGTKARLQSALAEAKTELKIDTDSPSGLDAARKKLEAMLPPVRPMKLEVGTDPESINRAIYEIDQAKADAEKRKIKLETEATGVGLMAAQLAFLSRPRTVPFYIRINERSLLVAEGILKSLSGYNTISTLGQQLESLFTKFDTIAIKGSAAATAVGNIVNVLGSVGTSLFTIGEGVVETVGLLAAAPALLTAVSAGLFVYTAAFDNFSNAFSEDAKKRAQALEELPPNALAAVESIRGLYDEIAHPVQDAFWDHMGTSLQDAINHLIPQVKDGLNGMARGAGAFTAGILNSFTEISQNGQLKEMFGNIQKFFEQTGQAAKPFFDGFNQFGIRGSEYLPQFGTWLKDLAIQFDAWATKSSKNKDINRWIEEGVQSLKDMWSIGGSVIQMFQGITEAVDRAGGPSLSEFADTMDRIGKKVDGEPFKTRLANIFTGAREGASLLKVGFLDLSEAVGDSSEWVGKLLTQLGGLGGKFLTNVAVTVDSQELMTGIDATVSGLDRMLLQLRPSFESLGKIIGGVGTIAGGVFEHMGPLINTVFRMVEGIVTQLSGPLAEAAGTLIDTMNGRMVALEGPVRIVGGLLQGILDVFNGLPDGIASAAVALGIFLLMRGQLSAMFTAIGNSGPFTKMRDNWVLAESAAGRYGTEAQRQFRLTTAVAEASGRQLGRMGDAWGNYTARIAAAETPLGRIGTAAGGAASAGIGGLMKAGGGLMSFLGGPWGVGLAVAGVAVSLFGEEQAKAKQKVEDLAASMSVASGQITGATKQIIAKEWMQDGTNWWDDLWRGTEKAKDGIKDLGLTSEEVTGLIANGGPKYDETIEKLKLIRDNIGVDPQAAAAGYVPVQMSLEELSKATGYTIDELKRMDRTSLGNVISQMETGRDRVNEAQQRVRDLAAASGIAEGDAGRLAGAIQVLGDKASTAAQRVGAIKTELDLLKGGTLSQDEATRAFEKSWESALTTLDGVVTRTDANGKKTTVSLGKFIDDATGKITSLKGAGGVLYDVTKDVTDSQLMLAQSTYTAVLNSTGSTEKATQAALDKLKLAPEQLQAFADKIGVPLAEAEALLSTFFAEDWQMTAIFSGNSELFFATKKKAEEEGVKFDQQYWEATLTANGLPSQAVIAETLAKGKDFSREQYLATLKALPAPALEQISKAVGAGDAYKRGDYSAIMKALNNTSPGLALALIEIGRVKNGNYAAAIKAFMDTLTANNTSAQLDAIASKQRSAMIRVTYEDYGLRPKIPDSIRAPDVMNGGVIDRVGPGWNPYGGRFPMGKHFQVKAFANGGIENHVAQIASPKPGLVRIWGEEETGGEAYIPLSMQKRTRSTQILREVATRFGYTLQAKAFADGGVVGAGSRERSGQVAVNIDSYIQQSNDTADDVARAIMRRVKSRGTYSPLEGF